jgi:hypothetical protein
MGMTQRLPAVQLGQGTATAIAAARTHVAPPSARGARVDMSEVNIAMNIAEMNIAGGRRQAARRWPARRRRRPVEVVHTRIREMVAEMRRIAAPIFW